MALRCVLAHLIRSSTSLRFLKPAAPPAKAPAFSYATLSGKITDEFTGAGANGQVCQVDGTEDLGRGQRVLNAGSPITCATSVADASPPAFPPFAGYDHTRDYTSSGTYIDGEGYIYSDGDLPLDILLSDDDSEDDFFIEDEDVEDVDEEVIRGANEELPK